MTATPHELSGHAELLAFLDERGIRYEVLDGCVLVASPAGFRHEDVEGAVLAQLWNAAPADLAVLGRDLAGCRACRTPSTTSTPTLPCRGSPDSL